MEPGKPQDMNPKINMAEKLVDVTVKLRQRGKKDQPPKLLCDIKMVYFYFYFLKIWQKKKKNIWTTLNGGKEEEDGLGD